MKIKLSLISFIILIFLSSCKKDSTTPPQTTNNTTTVDSFSYQGITYHTVTICNQVWMKENLQVSQFRNGDSIPKLITYSNWDNTVTAGYANYIDIEFLGETYGYLYNIYTVRDSRNVAPPGWRIPTEQDFQDLVQCLNGPINAAAALKAQGFTYWDSLNTNATNSSGFSALGGGQIGLYGVSGELNSTGNFWSQSNDHSGNPEYLRLLSNGSLATIQYVTDDDFGFSIRCIKE